MRRSTTRSGRALQICLSLFTLMAGVFIRPELVIEPGLEQVTVAFLILTTTIGITFSIQATFAVRAGPDRTIQLALAACAFVVLLHPSEQVAALAALPVGAMIGAWLWRRRGAAVASEERRTPVLAGQFADPTAPRTGRRWLAGELAP